MSDNVLQLFSSYCASCGKPIKRGERFVSMRTPEGEAQVHPSCMGGIELDPEPPPSGSPVAVQVAA